MRVQGGLSSFSLPDESPTHPAWLARYGDEPRSQFAFGLFRRERQALQRHALAAGLRMIIHGGLDVDAFYGPGALRTRLCILAQFLESVALPDDLVRLAWVDDYPPHLTLSVGDWVFAESLAGRPIRGALHTVFTTHAPTVTRRVAEFDAELAFRLDAQGTSPERSRAWVLDRMRQRIRELPPHRAWTCQPS